MFQPRKFLMSKYFDTKEFDSKDDPGSGKFMDPKLIEILDIMREECGFPFIINSGVRTIAHNTKEGGKPNSDHLIKYDGFAHAVDVLFENGNQGYEILASALVKENGIRRIPRIGIGTNFLHLGNWIGNPQNVIWTY
jgi:hypothetical protein